MTITDAQIIEAAHSAAAITPRIMINDIYRELGIDIIYRDMGQKPTRAHISQTIRRAGFVKADYKHYVYVGGAAA